MATGGSRSNTRLTNHTKEETSFKASYLKNRSTQPDSGVESKVTEDDFHKFVQHTEINLKQQKKMVTTLRHTMNKREKKMKRELKRKDQQIEMLKNSHKLALKVCGKLLSSVTVLKQTGQSSIQTQSTQNVQPVKTRKTPPDAPGSSVRPVQDIQTPPIGQKLAQAMGSEETSKGQVSLTPNKPSQSRAQTNTASSKESSPVLVQTTLKSPNGQKLAQDASYQDQVSLTLAKPSQSGTRGILTSTNAPSPVPLPMQISQTSSIGQKLAQAMGSVAPSKKQVSLKQAKPSESGAKTKFASTKESNPVPMQTTLKSPIGQKLAQAMDSVAPSKKQVSSKQAKPRKSGAKTKFASTKESNPVQMQTTQKSSIGHKFAQATPSKDQVSLTVDKLSQSGNQAKLSSSMVDIVSSVVKNQCASEVPYVTTSVANSQHALKKYDMAPLVTNSQHALKKYDMTPSVANSQHALKKYDMAPLVANSQHALKKYDMTPSVANSQHALKKYDMTPSVANSQHALKKYDMTKSVANSQHALKKYDMTPSVANSQHALKKSDMTSLDAEREHAPMAYSRWFTLSIRSVKDFRVGKTTVIPDIVALDNNLVLVADHVELKLQLFNMQGVCLDQCDISERCRIAKGPTSIVLALFPDTKAVEILKVTNRHIRPQTYIELPESENYTCIVSIDRNRFGVSFNESFLGIDIFTLTGVYMHTVGTGISVSHMCKASDGVIICSSESSRKIAKIDVDSGLEIFCHTVPQIPRLCGIAYSKKNESIFACGGNDATLSLLDNDGQFLKEVHRARSVGVYTVSVNRNTCIWEGHGYINYGKFVVEFLT